MSDKKQLNEEKLKVVNGGEEQEQQYVCRKCGAVIDINTADKKVVEINGDLSSSTQFGYWCENCQDYVAVVPAGGIPGIQIDQIRYS